MTVKSVYFALTAINLSCMIFSIVTGKGLWWFALFAAALSFAVALRED